MTIYPNKKHARNIASLKKSKETARMISKTTGRNIPAIPEARKNT